MDSLKGIKIARLKWDTVPETGAAIFDFQSQEVRDAWQRKSGNLALLFTGSKRSNFRPPTDLFVATAEVADDKFDDGLVGVIESPEFTVEQDGYVLYVSGGRDRDKLFVALVDVETGNELTRLTGDNNNEFKKYRVDATQWKGKRAVVRVVDQSTAPWGHINFGGIYEDPLQTYLD